MWTRIAAIARAVGIGLVLLAVTSWVVANVSLTS